MKLSRDQKTFLSEQGYLIMENVLDQNTLYKIKKRIKEIIEEEGIRYGQHYTTDYIRSLQLNNKILSKIKLMFWNSVFLLVRLLIRFIRNLIPPIQIFFNFYISLPIPYPSNAILEELNNIIITCMEQHEKNVIRLCNLINKGKEFEIFISQTQVLEAVELILGSNFKLSSLNYRNPKNSSGNQDLHFDFPWLTNKGDYFSANTLWLLDDMNENNGPTRIIPYSHKNNTSPKVTMMNRKEKHPDEVFITAKAGSVIILNSRIWHSGTNNSSDEERSIIQSFFVHRAHPSQQFQRKLITKKTRKHLNSQSKLILDLIYD
ncbi:MAG: ectoine hydroxylase-related dioxygenase (phytanoyl-CoA dioxygenase family) [Cyclobacteriaceae bacterium]|jgi:ectoine hydroxylase-related dioxygenase (phytanoyl-CoA dioxygenase family)